MGGILEGGCSLGPSRPDRKLTLAPLRGHYYAFVNGVEMSETNIRPDHDVERQSSSDENETKADDRKVCGIVMPIAAMGEDYPEAHWGRVRRIIQRAIERSGLRPQLVWENPEVDVIQTAILQNIFENDVVICDVSNLNPNVMLETGLRLSTKRPTIIITDRVRRPPFDISTISYIDYPRDLEYNATEDFINKLTRKIKDVMKALDEEKYKPYLEQFRFETVQPISVTVTTDEYVRERLDELTGTVRRILRTQEQSSKVIAPGSVVQNAARGRARFATFGTLTGQFSNSHADKVEVLINGISGVRCIVNQLNVEDFEFEIYIDTLRADAPYLMNQCRSIIQTEEGNFLVG